MGNSCDFVGYATRSGVKCTDGLVISKDAFAHQDGAVVPLVWNHQHDSVNNVLGKALLKKCEDGIRAFCSFNDSPDARAAKAAVQHGDVNSLSIFANHLKKQDNNVINGSIREVSLVLAGANPGAYIESVISHSSDDGECAVIYNDSEGLELDSEKSAENPIENELQHSDNKENAKDEGDRKMAENKEKTVQDVIDSMNEEQKKVLYALVGMAAEGEFDDDNKEAEMKHNVFDNEYDDNYNGADDNMVLSHADQMSIIEEAKRNGSLKDTFLRHAATYGIDDIEWLFPEYQKLDNPPTWINIHPTEWVKTVMDGVKHTPFARIKSMFADIRADEARAKGYVKGNRKLEEVFTLLRRTTDPQTVYKKQKLDRDDIIDITDFDVVSWIKAEMRIKLDEEIARAILVGDGRLASSNDKIQETHIRPIISDDSLFVINKTVTREEGEKEAHALYTSIIRAFEDYQGSGNPIFFTSQSVISDLLLLEDGVGRRLFNNMADLATTLRVSKIVPFPYLPSTSYGIIVNLSDYNVGADKGGSVNMFDDFDIDYNQMKYLIETRCSGALVTPYSAIVLSKPASNDNSSNTDDTDLPDDTDSDEVG